MTDFDLRKITGREPPIETDEDMMNALADALGDADALRTEREALRARVARDSEAYTRMETRAIDAEARVAELEADAARYRWLRIVDGNQWGVLGLTDPDGLDAAIDAARAAGNKSEVRK